MTVVDHGEQTGRDVFNVGASLEVLLRLVAWMKPAKAVETFVGQLR